MPISFSRLCAFHSLAFHLFSGCVVFLAVMCLCGCPKKQWSYTPPPAPAPSKGFDVHFDPSQLDPNGAPRNVDWEAQLHGGPPNPDTCNDGQPYSSACTQDKPCMDQPDARHEAFCFIGKVTSGSPIQSFFGHADWMVVQYDGSIGWFNFGYDFDYNLLIVPGTLPQGTDNEHGVTTNNNLVGGAQRHRYIELEWDSDETDGAFPEPNQAGAPLSWWAKFKNAAQAYDGSPAADEQLARLLHPSDEHTLACGSVVGLFGLDCDHGCRSEIHPVYGLAVQRTEDPNDNEWSVLVRNWGTGGYCSQYNDELAATSLSLVLPYSSSSPPTRIAVQDFVATTASGPGAQCPKVYFQDGQTILNVTLPAPQNKGVAAFSLKIQWPVGAQPAACTPVKTSEVSRMALAEAARPATPLRGEDYMGALLRGANQGNRPSLEKDISPTLPKTGARMQALQKKVMSLQPASCDGPVQVIPGRPPLAPAPAVHRLSKDPAKRQRDEDLRTYICQQYRTRKIAPPAGTRQQDLDQACKGVK